MARYRKKDKIVRKMDICCVGDYTERVLNENGQPIEERFDDFGIDHQIVAAFSRTGLWDHDPDQHLNLHSSHQIIAVRAGMILVEDGREKQPLYQNMAAFVPAGKPHRAVLMNENMRFQSYSLFVDPTVFPAPTDEIRSFELSELGAALLEKLNEETLVDISAGLPGKCLNLFLELLPTEMENGTRLIRIPEVKRQRNRKIVQFIRENYMNKIRLDHLTRVVSLSTRQITRSFQEELKIGVSEYIRLIRLLNASLYLHDRQRKIIDIAHDCGYDSSSTFYEDFKHHFGLPPNRFRAKILA